MRIISVQNYGDFGMKSVHSVWYGDGEIPEAINAENLNDTKDIEKYCKVLRKHGFKRCNVETVQFGGNT